MPQKSLMLVLLSLITTCTGYAYDWSTNPGSGTEADPYQISEPNHLLAINDIDTAGIYFVLVNNIDLDPNLPGNQVFTHIVVSDMAGTFDGGGFKILNLTGAGLFGKVEGVDAVIKNLGVENILSNRGSGGLVWTLSYGLIKNCYITGTIQGTGDLGGLVGYSYNNGIISDCYNQCDITSTGSNWYIGGLVGMLSSGQIIRCYNEGTITGENEVGGLVGEQNGEILQCYNLGDVIGTGQGYGVGGIVGFQMSGPVKDCYNSGSVEGYRYVGGVTGRGGFIQNCYNIGSVSGDQHVGGLSGFDIGSINSFWNLETGGITASEPRYGRTTAQMKQALTYIGWNDDGLVWVLDEGQDYPRLIWEGTPGIPLLPHSLSEYLPEGTGSEWDPYRIFTADQLDAIGLFPSEWAKEYSLENNIDANSLGRFRRIGTGVIPFTGFFEGNGYTISNFTYITSENEWCVGLFGLAQDAVIRNLRLENVNISTNDSGAGSIVGAMDAGILENCSSTGMVSGESDVGGLIAAGSPTITNCHSNCAVSGNNIIGGLIGYASGTISNCYSTGEVIGNGTENESIGGFAGQQYDGTIESCYSTGDVYGKSKVGGFVGMQYYGENHYEYKNTDLVIENCYSRGNVFGEENSSYIGGFIGYQYTGWIAVSSHNWSQYDQIAYIYNSYSAGHVEVGAGNSKVGGFIGYSHDGIISDSFWDIETSSLSDGVANLDPDPVEVFGKTTVEMQTPNTFSSWDFVGDGNGHRDVWRLCVDGVDYPRLSWEFSAGGDFACPDGVNLRDFAALSANWLTNEQNEPQGFNVACDANFDAQIDMVDLLILAENWLGG